MDDTRIKVKVEDDEELKRANSETGDTCSKPVFKNYETTSVVGSYDQSGLLSLFRIRRNDSPAHAIMESWNFVDEATRLSGSISEIIISSSPPPRVKR